MIKEKDSLEMITEFDLPRRIDEEVLDSNCIDKQDSDEYFKQYEKNEMCNNRSDLSSQYLKMSKEEKIMSLRELGYRLDVIVEMIKNETSGMVAYVNGHKNRELDNVSQEMISQQDGDSKFCDGIISELMPISTQVQQAKNMLDFAKKVYDDAVTLANKKIDSAHKIKKEYEDKLGEIKVVSGDNPSRWTMEQIEEYNSVTGRYNKIVREANIEAFNVKNKKEDYEEKKIRYKELKRKFGEQISLEVSDKKDVREIQENNLTQLASILVD